MLLQSMFTRSRQGLAYIRHRQQLCGTVRTSIFRYVLKPTYAHPSIRNFSKSNRAQNELVFMLLRFVVRGLGKATRYLLENTHRLTPEQRKAIALSNGIPVSLIGVYFMSHLETVPYTDRLHLRWLDDDDEHNLSQEAYQELLKQESKHFLDEKDPLYLTTKGIVDALIEVCRQDGVLTASSRFDFKLHIIKSNIANAFVLPDGSIFVYTGILPVAQTEGGLACVIGHELSHALAHHSSEKIGFLRFLMLLYEFIGGFIEDPNTPFSNQFAKFILGTLLQIGIPLAHSRDMETEADRMGLRIAARAGYDPRTGKEVWKRMMAVEESKHKHHEDEKDKSEETQGSRELPVSHVKVLTAASLAASANEAKPKEAVVVQKQPPASAPVTINSVLKVFTPTETIAATPSSAVSKPSDSSSAQAKTAVAPSTSNTIAAMVYNTFFPSSNNKGAKQAYNNDDDSDDDEREDPDGRVISGDTKEELPMITWRSRMRELLSTHPCHARRIQDLDAYAVTCMDDYYRSVDQLRSSSKTPPNSYKLVLKKKLSTEATIADTSTGATPPQTTSNQPEKTGKNEQPVKTEAPANEKKTNKTDKNGNDEVEFDEFDYGFSPPKETEDEYYQRLQLAQKCSALMVGAQADEIQQFLKSIGQDKQLWGHQH